MRRLVDKYEFVNTVFISTNNIFNKGWLALDASQE